MERLFPQEVDLRALSPLTLAFVGDGVYELMAREALVCRANRPNGDLQRGRNAHTARAGGDYHRATGLEALFGYLYLSGNIARCRELFSVAYGGGRTEDDGKKGR